MVKNGAKPTDTVDRLFRKWCLRKYCRREQRRVIVLGGVIMGELVEYIAKALVDHPDEVSVNEIEGSQSVIIELKVADEDMGKIMENKAV